MAMKTSGNLSIKTATGPGTDGEINTNVSGVDSGSLVTLGQNSTAWTGGTAPPGGSANTSVAPYGMREYYGYQEYVPTTPTYGGIGSYPYSYYQNLDNVTQPNNPGYNWKGFNSYWTSGTTPPGWGGTNGRYMAYSTHSTNFYGGGFQPFLVSRVGIGVEADTAGGVDANGNQYHFIRMCLVEKLRSSAYQTNNSNSILNYGAWAQPVSNPSWQTTIIFTEPNIPDSLALDVDVYQSNSGVFGTTVTPIYRSQNNFTNPYATANFRYNISSLVMNGSFFTYPGSGSLAALSQNQQVLWNTDLDIIHSSECSSSTSYTTIKFGLIARKSGFADTLLAHGAYGHRSSLSWQGGLCF